MVVVLVSLLATSAFAPMQGVHPLPVVPMQAKPVAVTRSNNMRIASSPPTMLSLPQLAAGANLASFGFYGVALVLKPAWLMKNVMMSDNEAAWDFKGIPCAIAQYLGAVYLAQALRMVRSLTWMPHMLKTDLLGVGFIQLFLCIVSLARLACGIDKTEVTTTLPLGQGLMASLALIGGSRL